MAFAPPWCLWIAVAILGSLELTTLLEELTTLLEPKLALTASREHWALEPRAWVLQEHLIYIYDITAYSYYYAVCTR